MVDHEQPDSQDMYNENTPHLVGTKDPLASDCAAGLQAGDEQGEESGQALLLALEAEKEKSQNYFNQLARAEAEMANLVKRQKREMEHVRKFALERFISDLLPVLDSLELGLQAACREGESSTESIKAVVEGMDMTLKMLISTLEKSGVKVIEPERYEDFNPSYHEAISTQPISECPSGKVLQVIQKGCQLNERLVRPALVVVSVAESQAGE